VRWPSPRISASQSEAEVALAEAQILDREEGPQREADRQKKETDDRELTRQKNQEFPPIMSVLGENLYEDISSECFE
jgi:hypothetical protein